MRPKLSHKLTAGFSLCAGAALALPALAELAGWPFWSAVVAAVTIGAAVGWPLARALSRRERTLSFRAAGIARAQAADGAVESARERAERLAGGMRFSVDAAGEAHGSAAKALECTNASVGVSRDTVARLERAFAKVDRAEELAGRFDESIRSVHRITEMITSVAEKTHLLSLNASIEAARAGDAGLGFSVVAEEIRNLAESAAGSAAEIGSLIGQLASESGRIRDAMREVGSEMRHGREGMEGLVRSLEQVRQAIDDASQRTDAISRASAERSADMQELLGGFERLARGADKIAAALDEVRQSYDGPVDEVEPT